MLRKMQDLKLNIFQTRTVSFPLHGQVANFSAPKYLCLSPNRCVFDVVMHDNNQTGP